MFRFDARLRVYVHRDAVDGRKGINGLAALVEQSLGLDPFAAAVYVFSNRRRDRIKLLLWERNGFWLMHKRLEAGRFVWPKDETVLVLTVEQLPRAFTHERPLSQRRKGHCAAERAVEPGHET